MAWRCSSQWLLATHTEQTWLRSMKSISMIVRRYWTKRGEFVMTFMPSSTLVTQAAKSLFAPGDLYHAQAAGTYVGDAVEVAQGRDGDGVFLGDVEDRLILIAGHVQAVDD